MMASGQAYDGVGVPLGILPGSDDVSAKIPDDSYDVYVNEDFVGKKTLVTQVEDIEDLSSHLQDQGFSNFSTDLEGDHYTLKVDDGGEAKRMKQHLEVYLQIR